MKVFKKKWLLQAGIILCFILSRNTSLTPQEKKQPASATYNNAETLNQLFSKINKLIKQNDFEEAITYLRKAESISPENKEITSALATVLNNYAISLSNRGQFDYAINIIEEAYTINPSNQISKNYLQILKNQCVNNIDAKNWDKAIQGYAYIQKLNESDNTINESIATVYERWGIELLSENQFKQAKDKFLESININKSQKNALWLLGKIEYDKQNLNEAKYYWERFLEISPDNEDIKSRVEQINRELNIQQDINAKKVQRFELYYDEQISNKTLSGIKSYLDKAYYEIGYRFSYYPENKVVVLIIPKDKFKYTTKMPHWVAGLYDGKIRIPITDDTKIYGGIIMHEYTHVIIHHLGKNMVPKWINEGLAELFSDEQNNGILKNSLLKNELIPLKDLDAYFNQSNDENSIQLAYQQSMIIMDFIKHKYGMYKIKNIIQLFSKGAALDEALRNAIGITVKELENSYTDYASNKLLSMTEQKRLRELRKLKK